MTLGEDEVKQSGVEEIWLWSTVEGMETNDDHLDDTRVLDEGRNADSENVSFGDRNG